MAFFLMPIGTASVGVHTLKPRAGRILIHHGRD